MFFLSAAATLAVHAATAAPRYTVKPGDSLSRIAASNCGKVNDWTGIYQSNRHVIGSNPNIIMPGERLRLACYDPPSLLAQATDGDGDHDGDTSDTPSPPPAPQHTVNSPVNVSGIAPSGSFQACVIARESGGNPGAVNPSSGAGGLYGFLPSTWASLGYGGLPENAPVWEQNEAFYKLYAEAGTSPWAPYDGC